MAAGRPHQQGDHRVLRAAGHRRHAAALPRGHADRLGGRVSEHRVDCRRHAGGGAQRLPARESVPAGVGDVPARHGHLRGARVRPAAEAVHHRVRGADRLGAGDAVALGGTGLSLRRPAQRERAHRPGREELAGGAGGVAYRRAPPDDVRTRDRPPSPARIQPARWPDRPLQPHALPRSLRAPAVAVAQFAAADLAADDRSGPLQAHQRHLRPPGRRRLPALYVEHAGRDAAPARRTAGALRRRGVHRRPARHGPGRGQRGGRGTAPGTARAAVPQRRTGDRGVRQHRRALRRPGSARQPGIRTAGGGPGAVHRQGRRAGLRADVVRDFYCVVGAT